MFSYQSLWPIVRRLPPEFAHALGLKLLRLPIRFGPRPPADPFTWNGLTFRNRIGIAAGFDKNAACIRGVERLGAGFLEVGTILTAPWPGNQVSPRMKRFVESRAIWNRLGFTSLGLETAKQNLQRVPRDRRRGMVVACNIGPHPGHLKSANDRERCVCDEFLNLASELHSLADLFVINLSSPNTPGLRSLLQSAELAETIILPVRCRIRELDAKTSRPWRTPLLIKLPPEDDNRELWSEESLHRVMEPLLSSDACDGFVAVNTSTRLALQTARFPPPELPGGISGAPLRAEALRVVSLVRELMGPEKLLIGCGGVMSPEHALEFRRAGADLVELYSGMIFSGPRLPARCAAALAESRQR